MICKNCGDNTKGKYCQNCGQKTDTHRLTVKHFFAHDLVHGMFHLDQGLPKTIWAVLTRPGHVALDYIFGKRKRYYNFFYLLLLIIGLYIFIKSFQTENLKPILTINDNQDEKTKGAIHVSEFIREQKKIVIFTWIPILALAAFFIFRRLKLTLLEFSIPATVAVIGSSIFNIILTITNLLNTKFDNLFSYYLDGILGFICGLSIFIFPLLTFSQFIKGHYTLWGKLWRLMSFYILSVFILFFLFFIVLIIVNGGNPNIRVR